MKDDIYVHRGPERTKKSRNRHRFLRHVQFYSTVPGIGSACRTFDQMVFTTISKGSFVWFAASRLRALYTSRGNILITNFARAKSESTQSKAFRSNCNWGGGDRVKPSIRFLDLFAISSFQFDDAVRWLSSQQPSLRHHIFVAYRLPGVLEKSAPCTPAGQRKAT